MTVLFGLLSNRHFEHMSNGNDPVRATPPAAEVVLGTAVSLKVLALLLLAWALLIVLGDELLFNFVHDRHLHAQLARVKGLLGMVGTAGILGWAVLRNTREAARLDASRRESESRYRLIVETADEGILLMDAGWRITFANARMATILELQPEQTVGRSLLDFQDANGRENIVEQMRLCEQGLAEAYEARLRRADGNWTWTMVSHRPLTNAAGGFSGVLTMVTDITERKHAEEGVRRSTERLQVLSKRLLEVQESERRQIAYELHDEIGQSLTAIKLNLQSGLRNNASPAVAPNLQDSIAIVERLIGEVRQLSLNLRPPLLDDLGLTAAIRWLLDQQAQRSGWHAEFHSPLGDARLEPTIETACFRIAQEALTNAARHARARNLTVTLAQQDEELVLLVQDDGIGFDISIARQRAETGGSLGILGMEERVALLGGGITWNSSAGHGTKLSARFPFQIRKPASELQPVEAVA